MSLEKYLQWCVVGNTVDSRVKDNSLVHTFTYEKKIRKGTKLINKALRQKFCKNTYTQFKQCKQKILKQLTENNDVTDESDFSDTDYKIFYESFNVSCTKNSHTNNIDGLSWNYVDKKGRHKDESEDSEPYHIWEPNVDIKVITPRKGFENVSKAAKIKGQSQIIKNAESNHRKKTPKIVIKFKNTPVKSATINNKEVSSTSSKVTKRKTATVKEKEIPKSKQSASNKSSKDVKKNLTLALDNVSSKSQESAGDEWEDEFASADFQAHSTQIFSDTLSEKKTKYRYSINPRLSREVVNQPRDSGIEEDSREDNTKFENHVNEKKYNKNQENDKNDESKPVKAKNTNNLKIVDNSLNQNEIIKSPNKKVPLKIIGEERVTKKFKIIPNKDKDLKPIEEKKKVEFLKSESIDNSVNVNSANEKSESSSESDSEFADCHNADVSQYNKSDKDSSDEYYDLQDDGGEGDFEDTQNESENEKAESCNSSTNESVIYKTALKEQMKRCKSPFMIRRYNELKKSGVFEESDVESGIKLIKTGEKKSNKKNLETPSKSNKSKKTSQFKVPNLIDMPKTQKQVKDDESFEEKTLVAENFIDNSILLNGLTENVDDIEDDIEEVTPNIAKLQQIKRLNLLADNDESDNSEDENIHKITEDKVKEKENCIYPNGAKNQQQLKSLDMLSTYKDSDESENHTNRLNGIVLNSNLADKKTDKTISPIVENVQNMSKTNENDSDSIVSEINDSQSLPTTNQRNKKKKKTLVLHTELADKDTSSAYEESVEIGNQSDLKNVVDNYKQILLPQEPKRTDDLNESHELPDIGTQFQPMESPDHSDSDDSENSQAEKTVISVQNKNEIQEKKSDSDSEKKDNSLKNKSLKVNKMQQEVQTLKESSSEESSSDLEEPKDDIFYANPSKNEDSEDECIMSSKSKENLNKMKRLDLLNSDEDSDDSENGITEKNHCNSDVDIEEHKIEDIGPYDDLEKKDKVLKNQLQSSDSDSSDKSDSEVPSSCVSNKSKSKHLSSGFTSFKNSGVVQDDSDSSSNSSKNKSIQKRKFTQIDTVDMNDSEPLEPSPEIDVVHYSSENDVNDRRKIKRLKSSNCDASTIAEEENDRTLSLNSFKYTKPDTAFSENENDDSDSDEAMSYSSKQKILRLKKMNLLANNSSSSSEDEKEIENSQCKINKDRKKKAKKCKSTLNHSDSDSDSKKKNDLDDFDAKIYKKQNEVKKDEVKKNEELDKKDDESGIEDEKDYILDDKNSKSEEDSEEECTMSSNTRERLNKMKRLDLLNSDEDSDDSEDGINDKNYCNSDVDIEEHKLEDILPQHDLKKNDKILKSQINSSDSNSEKSDSDKIKTKTKNSTKDKSNIEDASKNEITREKLASKLVPLENAEVDNSFEKEEDESKESEKSNNHIIKETQENAHSQMSYFESQPMFSSLEDLREGIDEKQLNCNIETASNTNSEKDTGRISSTQAPKKMVDKITKISQLVEKESLEKITCLSSMNLRNISVDEDIFILEVPRTIFNENLVGEKFSFSKTTLTVGNNTYEAVQKQTSPTYSCVFKTEKKALNSFTTENIRPVATIIARRKKFIDELAKVSDNEIDEDTREYSANNETSNFNGNNSSKDINTKKEVRKKLSKKSRKSENKEDLNTSINLNKEEPTKKIKSKRASKTDNSKKESKKLQRKEQAPTDDILNNDEIVKHGNLNNNTLSCLPEKSLTETTVKKTPKREAINSITSEDNKSSKPAKSSGKLKKVKPSTEDVKKTEETGVPDKKIKPVKNSEAKTTTKKRKAENQPNEDADADEKQETKKKPKVTAEKKEKPASKKSNPRNPKKKIVNESGESAADQIRKLIAKNIKFDDMLNGSFDLSNYNPLDVERIPKKTKRCPSTTSSSSSSDDDKFARRSFHMRVKSKPEDKSAVANSSSSSDVKTEDKKTVKKIFFNE